MRKLVPSLQNHSHSVTCRKTRKLCRFEFLRPPSYETVIALSPNIMEMPYLDYVDSISEMKRVKKIVDMVLGDKTLPDDISMEVFLEKANVQPDVYHKLNLDIFSFYCISL